MTQSVLIIAVTALVTVLLRALPFVIFSGERRTPDFILWLGKYLPYAIMGMLVVYCLRNVSLVSVPYGAPEFIACGAVALLHLWRQNTLLSIAGGTVIYMVLVQMVF